MRARKEEMVLLKPQIFKRFEQGLNTSQIKERFNLTKGQMSHFKKEWEQFKMGENNGN